LSADKRQESRPGELDTPVDTLFRGATVIDPETGLNDVCNVGIAGDRIVYVGRETPPHRHLRDVTGLTLAPGFIDLHSHAQTVNGLRLQSLDGVTTSLELEAGQLPVARHYRRAELEGRPINFGYSASWALARLVVLDGMALPNPSDDERMPHFIETWGAGNTASSTWRSRCSRAESEKILSLLEQEISDGALGIGVLLGYAEEANREEYFRLAKLAKRLDVPVFTHARGMSYEEPSTMLTGILEIVAAAAGTGARMHICHLNSTSQKQADEICAAVESAQHLGNPVTTEAYPYGAGSTIISAEWLEPEKLGRLGLSPRSIYYVHGAERITSEERLRYIQQRDPSGTCIVDLFDLDDEGDLSNLLKTILLPGAAIASDAIPLGGAVDPWELDNQWPVPDGAFAHPRSMGTFSKTLRWLVRELGVISLSEAVRRCSLIPAQILEEAVPAMRRKGRIQVGADADIVVFDAHTVRDTATYDTSSPSEGFRHVLVNGVFVVEDGVVHLGARPGRAIRSGDT
jgi:N-acyl-D-aspartate/D-glutamate deacylase